jgi:hypothetical protein
MSIKETLRSFNQQARRKILAIPSSVECTRAASQDLRHHAILQNHAKTSAANRQCNQDDAAIFKATRYQQSNGERAHGRGTQNSASMSIPKAARHCPTNECEFGMC